MASQSTDRWMTYSVTYICKQVVSLIRIHGKAIEYISRYGVCDLNCFPANSSGTAFEFVFTDGDIWIFWWLINK